RRQTARRRRASERLEVTGKRRQRIGVQHERAPKIVGDLARQRLRVVVEPEPGTDGHGVACPGQLVDGVARFARDRARGRFRNRLGHRLEEQRGDDGLLTGGGGGGGGGRGPPAGGGAPPRGPRPPPPPA